VADNILATKARKRIAARDSTLGERTAAAAVWAAMKAKTKIGMKTSLKTKKKKKKKIKRILPVAKRGGILPILPLLGILGSLAGGAAGIAKVMNDNKTQRQLEERKRHNRVMESHGLYLASHSGKKVDFFGQIRLQTF